MIFIEIKKWGDFDMSYTESVWYSMDAVPDPRLRVQRLVNELRLKTDKFTVATSEYEPSIGIYCGRNETKILNSFKTILKKNGFLKATTTQIQFSDESLEYGDDYEGEEE